MINIEIKSEIISNRRIKKIKVKKTNNKLFTNKLRRIIANPISYNNSMNIIYGTILLFLDYFINHKIEKDVKKKIRKVIDVIQDENGFEIKFNNGYRLICVFEIGYTKTFRMLLGNTCITEWIITDEEGIHLEYEVFVDLLESPSIL